MDKKDIDDGPDRLWEELTLRKERVSSNMPPWGGYSSKYPGWISPAANGYDYVYYNTANQKHRIYGPAYVNPKYDIEEWYKEGKLHRTDGGPALRHKHTSMWYKEGKLHRMDGPAVITRHGPKEYWIDGVRLPPKEYKREIARRNKNNKNDI